VVRWVVRILLAETVLVGGIWLAEWSWRRGELLPMLVAWGSAVGLALTIWLVVRGVSRVRSFINRPKRPAKKPTPTPTKAVPS
jgi:hypothetical protein